MPLRWLRCALLVCAVPLALSADSKWQPAADGARRSVEIAWDRYGIPHIRAAAAADLFRAFAWAQMESHGDLLLEHYGRARGKGAEYFGASYLEGDRWVLTNEIPARAQSWAAAQSANFRPLLDAFAAGINDYAAAHPDTIASSRRLVLPVSAADVLAHVQHAVHFTFVANRDRLARAAPASTAGSNGWAVAPEYASGKHAMLLINPHLPWSGVYRMFEAQLTVPGVVNAYGATFVGFPVLGIAFNESLGWTHTVNALDGADLFRVRMRGEEYEWDGKARSVDLRSHTIRIRHSDGTLATQELRVIGTAHGPVIAREGDNALALRVAGLDHPGLLEEWWDMACATGLEAFERVVRRLEIPIFTILYADTHGHIAHMFGGLTPRRDRPELPWWDVVPGNTSATLWSGYHNYSELPRVVDPRSGWLQNANEPPWWTTMPSPLEAAAFPPYMARGVLTLRAQQSVSLLAGGRLSFEEMIRRKHSTGVPLAERVLDDLLASIRAAATPARDRAATVLQQWDRRVDARSRGAVLFVTWATEMLRRAGGRFPYAESWHEDALLTSPRGLDRSSGALEVLDAVVARLDAAGTPLDLAWGERFRVRAGGREFAASGGPGELGVFRTLSFAPAKDGRFDAFFGDSFVAAVEFSRPPRARALLAYGNWSRGDAHQSDQLDLFARGELRPVWFSRAEIASNTIRTEVVPPRR